jgi:hypothetical protein
MVKREIPELWEDIGEIKYIGSYLKQALNAQGVYICADLLSVLEEISDYNEDSTDTKRDMKAWLEHVLENARAMQCCYPGSKIINGEECAYMARPANFKGYNALIKIMRYYAEQPWKSGIPWSYRGFGERRKYPRNCRMNII